MSSVGAERVSWRGVGNFILRVVRSSWFFQTMLTIQYTSRHLKKIPTFSTFRSPIDVDNRNLVVPYKRVRHPSQLHIFYMFYDSFFTRNQLRWSQTYQTLLGHPHRRRQPQPSGPLQASWSSKLTKHIIHVLFLILHKYGSQDPDMSDHSWTPSLT